MFMFELKMFFKTTLEKLKDNGWKIEKSPYANVSWCKKEIVDKDITTGYEDGCLYVAICDNSADLNFASAICEELKKLEVR